MKIEFITAPGPTPTPLDLEALFEQGTPPGYREIIEQTGAGLLTNWLDLLPPARIVEDMSEFRDRLREWWNWEESPPAAERGSLVRLAETVNADELVWSPTSGYWLLPADEEEAVALGASFEEAIAALFEAFEMPALYVFADDSVSGDEFTVRGKTAAEVAAWLSAYGGGDVVLHETETELGAGFVALFPSQRMPVTARAEDEDELLLEWACSAAQDEALREVLEETFQA